MTALTHSRLIELSRKTLITAQRVVADNAFAVSEARRVWKSGQDWKRMQKFARIALRRAAEFGLTAEKPYKIVRDDARYVAVVGMMGDLAAPLWHVKK